ncbi:hypothetical protein QBC34DRAFT_419389 [Podospora aff. communis PSN243]|uniref:F-box domain-containing protein n=1 Tax=Podospora aff. communis PSN243 TaxID=3040156 RepID=A0AAV9G373_9PEZI|nr:hypothetical protein QBC34DRAFT_419389 [Podospora aff. communis PSN243]
MAMLALPDELLLEIFNNLFLPPPPSPPSGDPKRHCAEGAALPKVCRRFHRLATPGLYTHLDVHFTDAESGDPTYSAKLLHRTLDENSNLHHYCRSLRLILPDPDYQSQGLPLNRASRPVRDALLMAFNITAWLKNTTNLFISGYFSHSRTHSVSLALVDSVGKHMPRLEKLSIGKQVWLERVWYILREIKQLRSLEIGIGVSATNKHPRSKFIGSSAITSLSVDYLLAPPLNLERLLLVPEALEHFTFRGMYPGCYWSWPLSQMITAVERHQTSLRTLQVASGRASGDATNDHSLEDEVDDVDLSGFTQLEGIQFVAAPVE